MAGNEFNFYEIYFQGRIDIHINHFRLNVLEYMCFS